MNIQQAIATLLARDVQKTEAEVDAFLRLFDMWELGWSQKFNERVHARYIETWLCTDTWVGTAIVFFDDKPLALTSKTARKNGTEVWFLETEGAEELRRQFREFLTTLRETDEALLTLPLTEELQLRDRRHYDQHYRSIADTAPSGA